MKFNVQWMKEKRFYFTILILILTIIPLYYVSNKIQSFITWKSYGSIVQSLFYMSIGVVTYYYTSSRYNNYFNQKDKLENQYGFETKGMDFLTYLIDEETHKIYFKEINQSLSMCLTYLDPLSNNEYTILGIPNKKSKNLRFQLEIRRYNALDLMFQVEYNPINNEIILLSSTNDKLDMEWNEKSKKDFSELFELYLTLWNMSIPFLDYKKNIYSPNTKYDLFTMKDSLSLIDVRINELDFHFKFQIQPYLATIYELHLQKLPMKYIEPINKLLENHFEYNLENKRFNLIESKKEYVLSMQEAVFSEISYFEEQYPIKQSHIEYFLNDHMYLGRFVTDQEYQFIYNPESDELNGNGMELKDESLRTICKKHLMEYNQYLKTLEIDYKHLLHAIEGVFDNE